MGDYQQDHLINTRLPKPSMKYETIPIYNFSPLQAPQRQAYLLFERLFPNTSLGRTDTIRPLNVPSTELVDGFLREDFGSLYINGLKKTSHYEIPVAEFEVYQSEASRRSIKLRIHQGHPSPTILGDDSYQFILHNGIEHEEMINAIGFEELADDLLFTSPGSVPILNSRLNRGMTIGFTPSHYTARNPSSGGIAEPLLILGSMRYTFLFVLMTRHAKSQAQQAGFVAPFSDLSGDFANQREFATRIHESNELENLTIVAYVHEFQHVSSFLAWLKAHFDGENCPHPSWDVAISAWKTFFLPKLGRYVTVVIIGNSMGTFRHGMVSMLDLESGPSPPCSVHAAVIHSIKS
jgi:hypothetical protein